MSTLATRTRDLRTPRREALAAGVILAYKEAAEARRSIERQWDVNIAYQFGYQWDPLEYEGVLPERPRKALVYNLIAPAVQRAVSRLTAQQPWSRALPATDTPEDLDAARLATKLLDYWLRTVFNTRRRQEHATWLAVAGTAFWKVGWDRYAGRSTTRRPLAPGAETILSRHTAAADQERAGTRFERWLEAFTKATREGAELPGGPAVTAERLEDLTAEGDVLVEVVDPYQVFPEPAVQAWDRLNWVIHARRRSRSDVLEVWGEEVAGNATTGSDPAISSAGFDPARLPVDLGAENAGSVYSLTAVKPEQDILILEYYERASLDFPDGRRVMVVGGQTVEDGPNPFPFNDFPLVPVLYESLPGSIWGRGVPETIIPAQREFNRTVSEMGEEREYTAHPNLVIEEGSQVLPRQIANLPGHVLTHRPGSSPPFWLQAPQLPAHLGADLQQAYLMIQDLTFAHETTYGTTPPNVRSGTAIQALQEADERPLRPIYDAYNEAMAEVGLKLLRLAQRFYTTERTIRLVGPDKLLQVQAFTGANLEGVVDVMVEPESGQTQSLAARRQFIIDLFQLGLFGPVGDQVVAKRVLQLLEFGRAAEIFEGPQTLDEVILDELRKMASQPGGVATLVQFLREAAGPVTGPPGPGALPQGAGQIPGMGPALALPPGTMPGGATY